MTEDRFAGLRRALASRKVAIIDRTSDPQGLLTDDVRALLAAHDAAAVPADAAGMVEEAKRAAAKWAGYSDSDVDEMLKVPSMKRTAFAAIDALARLAAQGQRQGWQWVPMDPTMPMLMAGSRAADGFGTPLTRTDNAYKAMLAAAPTQEADDVRS